MNHVFKLIWSRSLGMLVPVPEGASAVGAHGRRVRRRLRRLARKALGENLRVSGSSSVAAALAGGLVFVPMPSFALPTGGQVAAGQASLSQGANSLTVTQSSQTAILNWQSFNVAAGETVTFQQPSTSSVALNRVLGNDPSAIYGALNANGQVFLVNPNGITFARGAQVNVGGIVASTLGISDQDFIAGHYHFAGSSDASVVNDGTITAAPGGYVALVSRSVDNEGSITTPGGTTALGAGGSVDLTLAGNQLVSFQVSGAALDAAVKNGGAIRADDGTVILSAQAKNALLQTVVNNTGVIQAQGVRKQGGVIQLLGGNSGTTSVSGLVDASAPNGKGGSVTVTGQTVVVKNGARIVATGAIGGGKIAIGGGVHGGSNIAQAYATTVEQGVTVDACATVLGDGGQISVWSDVTHPGSLTEAYGSFRATGGVQGGNGGFIETSGHVLDVNGATVDTSAANGTAGTWLLDPYNLTVTTNSTTSVTTGVNTAAASNSTILASSISTALASGNVTLQTTGTAGSQAGDITVNGAISWSANTQLTLDAAGSITVNAPITVTGNPTGAALNFYYGQGAVAANNTATEYVNAPVNLYPGMAFTTKFGSDGTQSSYSIVTDPIGLQFIGHSGHSALGANIALYPGSNFAPIGSSNSPFTGVFDGLGHTITNLRNTAGNNNVGLFGTTQGATIRNVVLPSVNMSGKADVGSLVGFAKTSKIDNVYASGSITGSASGSSNIGGLIGQSSNSDITNSYASAQVRFTNLNAKNAGGLVGTAHLGSIKNSYASGAVSGTNTYYSSTSLGGLVGSNSATLSNVYATGAVFGGYGVGGLIGLNAAGTIQSAYATGNVTGAFQYYYGGLVGHALAGQITDTYATGSVTVGSGGSDAGGLIGFVGSSIILTSSYASGAVSSVGGSGGLIGGTISGGSISSSYWDISSSGQQASLGGVGLTSTQMQQANSFAGFTFGSSGPWTIYAGHTTPLLTAFMTPVTVSGSATKTYSGASQAVTISTSIGGSPSGGALFGQSGILMLGASPSNGNFVLSGTNVGTYTADLWSDQQGYLINASGAYLTITSVPQAPTVTQPPTVPPVTKVSVPPTFDFGQIAHRDGRPHDWVSSGVVDPALTGGYLDAVGSSTIAEVGSSGGSPAAAPIAALGITVPKPFFAVTDAGGAPAFGAPANAIAFEASVVNLDGLSGRDRRRQ